MRHPFAWGVSPLVGVCVGEAAVPGPPYFQTGFDDPEADMGDVAEHHGVQQEDAWCAPPDEGMGMRGGEPFIAAREFAGARLGYVFKLSKLGLGYYIDYQDDPFVAADIDRKEVCPSYLEQLGTAETLSLRDLLFAEELKQRVGQKRAHRKRPKGPGSRAGAEKAMPLKFLSLSQPGMMCILSMACGKLTL